MRHLYWYLSTFIKKHGWIFLISLIVAIVFFSLVVPIIVNNLNFKKLHYIGLIGEYTLDNLPTEVEEQISYGLMSVQSDNEILPALAEKYSLNDENTTYTFTLKNNLLWQDGKTIEVTDINYSLPGVTTVQEGNHLAYTLSEPYAPFLTRLTQPVLRYVEEPGWFGQKEISIIGIGDNRLTDFQYKDQSNNKLGQVTVENPTDKWIYRFYLTEEQAIQALKSGAVDEVRHLSSPRDLESWSNMDITEQNNQDQYLGLFFNLNDARFTKNVRQAFAYALEKGQVGTQATSPISQKSWAYFKGVKKYDKNLEKAVERLLSEMPGEPLDVQLITNSQNYSLAEEIARELTELGEEALKTCQSDEKKYSQEQCPNVEIKVEILVNNFPNLDSYQLLLIGQKIPLDPDQYSLWHSDQPGNFTHYKNTRVDALLENGRQMMDKKERTSIYQEFQQVFLEDSPVAFLDYITTFNIKRK